MLIAEDRDLDWAEETERRITRFVGLDQDGDQFDLFGVECRKSICESQAVGDNPSSGPIWDRVVDDITNQPWNDFNQTSSSTEVLDRQLVVLTHLLRKDSKYEHCFVNPDQGTCPYPEIEQ